MKTYLVKCVKGYKTPIEIVANDIELAEIYRKQTAGILTIVNIKVVKRKGE